MITDRIPTWGWAVGGILIIGAAFLLTRGGSSSSGGGQFVQSGGTQAPDVNDILAQLQDAANQLPGSKTITETKTVTIKEKSLWGSDVPAKIRNQLSSESAATLFKRYGVKYGSTINMGDLERLLKKMNIKFGKAVNYKEVVKAGVITNLPTTSTTTTNRAVVQSSNNEVDA